MKVLTRTIRAIPALCAAWLLIAAAIRDAGATNFDPTDVMTVTPAPGLTSSGPLGGPFAPTQQSFTLTNTGTTNVNWSASKSQPWLDLSATSGTLVPNGTTTVVASLNGRAAMLPPGAATTSVSIVNTTANLTHTRDVVLTVGSPQALFFPLDSNPGWSTTGEWAFGTPTGGGGASNNRPDPTSGKTGTNVFGVNLNGDYSIAVGGPYRLTTTALNLTNLRATRLRFWRWLNTDNPPYVSATVEVSTDGTNFNTIVFDNKVTGNIADSAWTQVEYDISSVADNQPTVFVRWSYQILQTGAYPRSGWNIDDVEILGYVPNAVTVTLPATTAEGAGTVNGTVSVSPTPTSNLVVSLFSSDPTELTVPATITIPANQSSAPFTATVLDDTLLDGTQTVTVLGATPGSTNTSASIGIADNETTQLTVTLPASTTEGATNVTGSVKTGLPVAKDTKVNLSSSNTNELTVPATVTILAGQTTATIPLTLPPDGKVDGPQTATVTAQVTNWTSGMASTVVNDSQARTLTVAVSGSTAEGASPTGKVSLTGQAVAPLLVTLTSNNTGAVQIPATITILAGETEHQFPISIANDAFAQGVRSVTITASAPTFTSGSNTIQVTNDDPDHFTLATIADPQYAGVPFSVTISARDASNFPLTNYTGTIGIGAIGDNGPIQVTPATLTGFANGQVTATVTIPASASNVALRVTDDSGHTGASNTFNVRTGGKYFTQLFTGAGGDVNDTGGHSFTFTPDGSPDFYNAVQDLATALPTDPTGGNTISLSDNASVPVTLSGGAQVAIYGTSTSNIFIGSNGYVTFQADTTSTESLAAHFASRRVSALFDDLKPNLGGSVSYKQLADRFAVTWLNVPKVSGGPTNTAQIEFFFDGRIRITTLTVTSPDGLIGLSAGPGAVPTGFVPTKFTSLPTSALSFSTIADVTIPEDGTSGPIPFAVTTPGVDPTTVTVTATSSNQAVIPNAKLTVGGTGLYRTIEVKPLPNVSGSAVITLSMTVSGNTITRSFNAMVQSINDAPTFTAGADQVVLEDSGASLVANWASAMSAGPSDESSQALTFLTTNDNPALFTVQPVISSGGTLSYTLAPDAAGIANVTVVLADNGGVVGGGASVSSPRTFKITVTDINDAPSFTKGPDLTILEDSLAQSVPLWATAIKAGPASEHAQTLNFTLTNDNPGMFTVQPAISSSGTLTYTPAANAIGIAHLTATLHDNGGTANGGVDSSAPQAFTISITQINDVPSFTKGSNRTVLEDAGPQTVTAWATNISAGQNEASQAVNFIVTNNKNSLFSVQPAIAPDGTLTFTTAPDANGSATVTVQLHDNGGTANGGVDTSAAQTFTIAVTAVNDVPSFVKGGNQVIMEEAGAQTVPGWATGMSAGPADESTQTLSFLVTADVPSMFSVAPAVAANGTLTYTPAANANGVATISVRIKDSGSTTNGGVNTSGPQTFTITMTGVNDAPSFTKGADQTVLEDSVTRTVNGWATSISAGPSDSGQMVDFIVTAANPALFAVQPAISPAGILTFTPAHNANGSSSVSVRLHDDGGTSNGGVDLSAAQTFTITITPVNDAPSFTKGADPSVPEDSGARSIAGWASAISAGPVDENAQIVSFLVTNDNAGLFSTAPAVASDGTLTFTPAVNATGTANVTVRAKDNGGVTSGGVDTSAAQTFVITVSAVNDPPSFTKGADQTVAENSSARVVNNWATAISKGPADEVGQAVSFVLTTDKPELFSVQPAVSATGALSFTPMASGNGVATVSIRARDNGGTANGGIDESAAQTFMITITPVNDAPSFTKGADQIVLEDSGPRSVVGWASAINAGPPDENTQLVSFLVTNDNAGLFSTAPAVASDGTLTFTPAANANGTANVTVRAKDNGGVTNGGVDTSAAQTFVITVTAVNDPPSFTKGADQTVAENSSARVVNNWATAISKGPADEAGQAVTFVLTTDKPELFSVQPAVSATGALSFTPVASGNGVATVSIKARDNGGIANGGINESASQTFTITITAVNNPPSFTKGPNQTVLEDSGPRSVVGWATNISAGPPDEIAQTLQFIVTNNNSALFAVPPAVDPSGTLSFTPAADANGSATVTVALKDNGGGTDTSPSQTFSIAVTPVNDPPTFTKGADQVAAVGSGPHTILRWATNISAGPANEAGQNVNFTVSVDKPEVFTALPQVSATGSLTFTPAGGAGGLAQVTVTSHDSGGTSNGGVDAGVAQTFSIDILGIPQLAGRYDGLAEPAAGISLGHNTVGLLNVKGTTKGQFTGKLSIFGSSFAFAGIYGPDGIARFGRGKVLELELPRLGKPSYFIGFHLLHGDDGDRLEGTLREGPTQTCVLTARRAAFDRINNPVPTSIVDPATDNGHYTALFRALPAPNGGLGTGAFPQGDGFATVSVNTAGLVTMRGRLADGAAVSYSATLSQSFLWPFYVQTDKKAGSCSGLVQFRDVTGQSDFDGLGLNWFKPVGNPNSPPKFYPLGWPSGIKADLLGSRYVATPGMAVLDVTPPDADGNATVSLGDGGLAAQFDKAVNLSTSNSVEVIAPAADALKLKITTTTGALSGSFADGFGGPTPVTAKALGVIFQKQQIGSGYFLGTKESGFLHLAPQR